MSWSPEQYLTFEDERTRPVRDLVGAIPGDASGAVVDIGCGPGNSTEVLAKRFPGAKVSGLDSSAEMIAAARQRLPNVQFEVSDLQTWSAPGPFDALLSNAVLQWVPNHAALFPRFIEMLSRGGSLAVQMPDNYDEPALRLMRETANEGPWRNKLESAGRERTRVHDPDWYYALLRPLCSRLDIWRTTYFHALTGGAEAIVEWFKGSGLRPYLAALEPDEQAMFLARYRSAVADAYPALPDGVALLPFPRLFIVATR